MSNRVNLLEGNIAKSLTQLALPIMATSIIQMAYNMTDMIWIGRVGSGAVAAVGAAGMYGWLSQSLAALARTGGQVRVAQCIGAGDVENAARYAKNSLQLGAFFSIIFGLIMVFFTAPLISFFRLNDPMVVKDAQAYLAITGGLIIFSILIQIFTGLITATGNSRTPFLATMVGLVINIVLDPVLIFGFGPIPAMGVAGAAWATVFGQFVVLLLLIKYASQDMHLFMRMNIWQKPDFPHLKEILRIGLPTGVQSAIFTLISMTIARLIAGWGDAAVAVQKVGSQIESISWMTADGFASAVSSFVAQNHGADNFNRAKKGYYTAISVIAVWGIFATLLLIFGAAPIFKIFIPDTAVVPLGVDYLIILGFSQFFMCLEIVTGGAFAGFGKTLPPSIAGIILTAARVPMALVLSSTLLGLNGVWWSISISSIMKGIVLVLMFQIFLHKLEKSRKLSKPQ